MNSYAVTYKGRIVKVFKSYESATHFYEKFCDTLSTFELEYVDIVELDSDGNLTEAKIAKKQIQEGKTNIKNILKEDTQQLPNSEKINDFIEDLYDLRKESIEKDGEYGVGNLIFKEFRNLGYLDNLKELKNQEKSKELSLENLNKK